MIGKKLVNDIVYVLKFINKILHTTYMYYSSNKHEITHERNYYFNNWICIVTSGKWIMYQKLCSEIVFDRTLLSI